YQVTSSTVVDARRDGIGSVKDGHQVSVLAMVSGGTATATDIQDLSLLRAGNPGPGGDGSGVTSRRETKGPGPAWPAQGPGRARTPDAGRPSADGLQTAHRWAAQLSRPSLRAALTAWCAPMSVGRRTI